MGCGPNAVAKDHCKDERNTYNMVPVSLTASLHELIDAAHLSIHCCGTLTGTFELERQSAHSKASQVGTYSRLVLYLFS